MDADRSLRAELAALRVALERSEVRAEALEARVRRLEDRGGAPPAGAGTKPWALTEGYGLAPEAAEDDNDDSSVENLSAATEEESAPVDAPEDLFAYCTVRLTDEDSNVRLSAGVTLLASFLFQTITALCYFDACRLSALLYTFTDLSSTYRTNCFYQGRSFMAPKNVFEAIFNGVAWKRQVFGVANPHVVVSVFCLWLLAMYFKRTNMDLLKEVAIIPSGRNLPGVWRLLVYCAEVSRTVVVPTALATGAAFQLSQCSTVNEIILDCFGVSFLLDLDRLLYDLALSPEQKHAYTQHWDSVVAKLPRMKRHRVIPNVVFLLDMSLLVGMFCVPKLRLHRYQSHWLGSEAGQAWFINCTDYAMMASAWCRTVVLRVAMWREHADFQGVKELVSKIVMTIPMCTVIYFFIFSSWLASDNLLDYHSITSCQSGENPDACKC